MPGEKLFEELLVGEKVEATSHSRIMTGSEIALKWEELEELLETLFDACLAFDAPRIRELLVKAPLGYQPQSEPVDLVWAKQAAQGLASPPAPAPQGGKRVALRSRPTSTAS